MDSFGKSGKIWKYRNLLKPEPALIQKYRFLCDWLDLKRADFIAVEIRKLEGAKTDSERGSIEAAVKALITKAYNL